MHVLLQIVCLKNVAELALENAHETLDSNRNSRKTATTAARKFVTRRGIIAVRNGHYNVVVRTVIA